MFNEETWNKLEAILKTCKRVQCVLPWAVDAGASTFTVSLMHMNDQGKYQHIVRSTCVMLPKFVPATQLLRSGVRTDPNKRYVEFFGMVAFEEPCPMFEYFRAMPSDVNFKEYKNQINSWLAPLMHLPIAHVAPGWSHEESFAFSESGDRIAPPLCVMDPTLDIEENKTEVIFPFSVVYPVNLEAARTLVSNATEMLIYAANDVGLHASANPAFSEGESHGPH